MSVSGEILSIVYLSRSMEFEGLNLGRLDMDITKRSSLAIDDKALSND